MSSIPRTQVKNKQGIAQETIIPALRRQRQVDICVSPPQPPHLSLTHTHETEKETEGEGNKKEGRDRTSQWHRHGVALSLGHLGSKEHVN